jgi:hypothetical protein
MWRDRYPKISKQTANEAEENGQNFVELLL